MTETEKITHISARILPWFAQNARELPWRKEYTPYHVWISEIMLQQTQMERGVRYFERWMQRFPTIKDVAQASEEEILHAWEGLGYYSRARNIHKAAQKIMQEHGGVFPNKLEYIRALPGIGPYTTGAIGSIAFKHSLPCIDANVERILARVFDLDTPVKQDPAARHIRALALALAQAAPKNSIREHNQAMMELGAMICRKKARCEMCPLQDLCESYHLNIVQERPIPGKKAAIKPLLVVTGVLRHEGKIFVQKRLPQGVWGNLWEFPGGRIEEGETPEEAIVREFKEETDYTVSVKKKLAFIKHGYTTYRISLHCFELAYMHEHTFSPILTAATEYAWLYPHELRNIAMPAAHRKLADIL